MFMAVSNQEIILKAILIEALYIWKVVKKIGPLIWVFIE